MTIKPLALIALLGAAAPTADRPPFIYTLPQARVILAEETDERYFRRERRMSSMSRRVALPSTVEDGRTEAELKDGVLTLRIPKSEAAKPRKVQIK